MNLKFGVAGIFLIFLSLARPVSQDAPQPQQLIQAANAATDLRTLRPYTVQGEDIHLGSLNPDLVDFSPLQNALEFETCDDPKPARMVEVIDPSYPQMAKIAHVQGDVYFSAVLGKDGALQDIKVVSGHPILVQAALDAVRQWRYAPTTCGSTPVGVETGIVVRFHMD